MLGLQLVDKRSAEAGHLANLFQSQDARLRRGGRRYLRRRILSVVVHAITSGRDLQMKMHVMHFHNAVGFIGFSIP